MMIIIWIWSVEVVESVEGSSHGAQAWEMGVDGGVPHSLDSSSSNKENRFLSWYSPTGSSDEEYDFPLLGDLLSDLTGDLGLSGLI